MLDKNDILGNIKNYDSLILDIGCGPLKKHKTWIGIDMLNYSGVDIVGDIYQIIKEFPANSVDKIYSSHFFEHIPDVTGLLREFERVLKKGGEIEIIVPHFSNPYFYSDYTHKSFFGLYSFSYLIKENIFKRRVPNYGLVDNLELKSVLLRYNSPLYINRPFRKMAQLLFNCANIMKEWYEDSWSKAIPCYEIKFNISKV